MGNKKAKHQRGSAHNPLLGEAGAIFSSSIQFFRTYPISILPLLLCWVIYASTILYMEYGFNWDAHSTEEVFLIVFGTYVLFSMIYGCACLILLEMVQQVENGERLALGRASRDALFRNFWKAIPILLVWAVLWFILVVLEALFSKKKEKSGNKDFSARSAVGTMLGDGDEFSLSSAFFRALSKGIRMTTFLILPAIAWEDLSTIKAFKKGLTILRETKKSFLVAYGTTGVFAFLVMIVPALIYFVDSELSLNLPEPFWYIVLIYIAFASSLTFLVEQLYVAQLYLWYISWERQRGEGKPKKKFGATKPPSFFDDVYSLQDGDTNSQ